MKFQIKAPGKQELTKLLTAAAAKQNSGTAQQAAAGSLEI